MNDLSISIKQILEITSCYLTNGKYRTPLKIFLLLFSAIMIFTAGKRLGGFIYHITNY